MSSILGYLSAIDEKGFTFSFHDMHRTAAIMSAYVNLSDQRVGIHAMWLSLKYN